MIFEVTRDYSIIVPLMIANLISFFISYKLQKEPIYEALARQDGVHLPSAGGRSQAGKIQVVQAMRTNTDPFLPDTVIETAIERLARGGWDAWPVTDSRGLVGMVRDSQLEIAAADGAAHGVVADLLTETPADSPGSADELPHVHPDHLLGVALERMGATGLKTLPVVSRANVRELIGIVTLNDILNAYGVHDPSVVREGSD